MSLYKLADTIVFDFTTHNPVTGAVSNADSLPTCEVFEDSNDTGLSGVTVTQRVGKTGNYRVAIVATTGNGYEIGKNYNVVVSVTVNSVSAKSCIASFVLDGKRADDLLGKIDVVEGTLTYEDFLRVMMAALSGISNGGGTATINFRNIADTKNRIQATVDANGNRTAMAFDLT